MYASGMRRFHEPTSAVDEPTKEVNIRTEEEPRLLTIASNLPLKEEEALIEMLREYKDSFAWSYDDMPGIDPELVEHSSDSSSSEPEEEEKANLALMAGLDQMASSKASKGTMLTLEQFQRLSLAMFSICPRKVSSKSSVTGYVKGTKVTIFEELLIELLGCPNSGHKLSEIVPSDKQKMGIIGSLGTVRKKDLLVNELSAEKRLIHSVITNIITPRAGTHSSIIARDEGQVCQGDLSGCRGIQKGRVLVVVWATIALRLVMRRHTPSRLGGRRLKGLASSPFPLLWLFLLSLLLSEEGMLFPLTFSGSWSLAEWRRLMAELEWHHSFTAFPMLPSPLWCDCSVWVTPGCSIPAVYLPTDAATTERIATSEEALPRSDATLSRMLGVCVVRLWSHVVAPVFRELHCLSGCMLRVVASAFVGVPAALADPWVVARSSGSLAGAQEVASFPAGSRCELQKSVATVAGCACYERGCWFTRAAVGFVVGLHVFGIFARAKQMLVFHVAPLVERCDTCLWLLSALCLLVVNSGKVLPEFFSIGSDGSLCCLVGRRCVALEVEVHRLVAVCSGDVFPDRLAVPLCVLVSFPERCLGGFSGGSPRTGSPRTCSRCFYSSACCSVSLRWSVLFGRLVLCVLVKVLPKIALCRFWWSSPRMALGFFGGGSPQSCPVVVLVVAALSPYKDELSFCGAGQLVFLFVFEFLGCTGGTSCVPVVGWFALLLAPCVLSQMVVCCALEILVAVWCVALSAYGGRGSGPVWPVLLFLAYSFFRMASGRHSLCGRVMVVTTGKSWYDLVVPLHLLCSPTSVASEVPDATAICVMTSGSVAFLSHPVNDSFIAFPMLPSPLWCDCSLWATPGCSIPAVCLPTNVTTAEHVMTSEEVSPSLGGCESTRLASGVSVASLACRRVPQVVPCVPALAGGPSGGYGEVYRACLCLLGLLSPFPGTPILGSLLREFSGLRACSISPSQCLALRWFQSRIARVGMGPQLGRVAVWFPLCEFSRVSCVDTDPCFYRPFLGAVRGGTRGCSSLTSWSVQSLEWFYLWALDLVEIRGWRRDLQGPWRGPGKSRRTELISLRSNFIKDKFLPPL
ncbi:hypothetical protein Taro_038110 [Colocasia esculenta]|uniref:Uncharacterized protein n=1 Tax=Colocasia esculenta TaxID=4460 RepID=A0A843WMR0_COLES|nr:hypothetical protein [Colocasia esculenta]